MLNEINKRIEEINQRMHDRIQESQRKRLDYMMVELQKAKARN